MSPSGPTQSKTLTRRGRPRHERQDYLTIVEDDAVLLRGLKDNFEAKGYQGTHRLRTVRRASTPSSRPRLTCCSWT